MQVYEMSSDAAKQTWRQQLLYTAAGGIVTHGSEGTLALHQAGNTLRLLLAADGTFEMVATLNGAIVVSASCTGTTQEATAGASSTAADQQTALDAVEDAAAPEASAAAPGQVPAPAVKESGKGTGANRTSPSSEAAAAAAAAKLQEQVAVAAAVVPATSAAEGASAPPLGPPSGSGVAAASAVSTALRVCTPQGLVVEVNTDGRVMLAPVQPSTAKVRPARENACGQAAPVLCRAVETCLLIPLAVMEPCFLTMACLVAPLQSGAKCSLSPSRRYRQIYAFAYIRYRFLAI